MWLGPPCKANSYTRSIPLPTTLFGPSGYSYTKRQTILSLAFDATGETTMTTAAALALNPFSLMMEPELVLQTMERSQQLRGLRRHKLRPLDKPLIPYTKEALASRAAYDAAIDADDFENHADAFLN